MLKLDLHVHSHYSPDGITSCERILELAESRGLDGLAITDHDFFDRDLHESLNRRTDLLLVPAEEISSTVGHILAYFIEEPIEPWRDPEDIVEDIHDQGGIAVAAHPYRIVKNYPREYFGGFDAVEVFNSRSGDPNKTGTPNYRSQQLVDLYDIPVTGGSDSHLPWTIGNGSTVVESDKSLVSLRENLLSPSTKTTGVPSYQTNRALSQFVRLFKEPSLEAWVKYLPKSLTYIASDFVK